MLRRFQHCPRTTTDESRLATSATAGLMAAARALRTMSACCREHPKGRSVRSQRRSTVKPGRRGRARTAVMRYLTVRRYPHRSAPRSRRSGAATDRMICARPRLASPPLPGNMRSLAPQMTNCRSARSRSSGSLRPRAPGSSALSGSVVDLPAQSSLMLSLEGAASGVSVTTLAAACVTMGKCHHVYRPSMPPASLRGARSIWAVLQRRSGSGPATSRR